jgi:hypothetical protein
MERSDAETVIMLDMDDSEYSGRINLGISDDEYVYFENQSGIVQHSTPENNFVLQLKGYYGKILLPKHAVIDISTHRDIYGKIASPAAIVSGMGDIFLDIDKGPLLGSPLELCIKTSGALILNGGLYPDKKSNKCIKIGNKSIEELMEKYRHQQRFFINNNIIATDEDMKTEYPQKPSELYLDLCKSYNLVIIEKIGGLTNITFEKNDSIEKNTSLGVFRDNIKYLRRALKKAIIDENYEKAVRIRNKIEKNHRDIEAFDGKMTKAYNVQQYL